MLSSKFSTAAQNIQTVTSPPYMPMDQSENSFSADLQKPCVQQTALCIFFLLTELTASAL